jgi:hypothetical protein
MGQHQQTGRSASSNGAAGRDGATREYLVLQSFSVLLDYSNLDPPIRANGTIKHGSASATYHNSYAGQTFYLFKPEFFRADACQTEILGGHTTRQLLNRGSVKKIVG